MANYVYITGNDVMVTIDGIKVLTSNECEKTFMLTGKDSSPLVLFSSEELYDGTDEYNGDDLAYLVSKNISNIISNKIDALDGVKRLNAVMDNALFCSYLITAAAALSVRCAALGIKLRFVSCNFENGNDDVLCFQLQ